jgi:hypothetical protein
MARTVLGIGIVILSIGILFHLAIWILRVAIPLGILIVLVGVIWLLVERANKQP